MGLYQEFNKLAEMIDFDKVDTTPQQEIRKPKVFKDLLSDEEQEMKRMEAEDTIREQEARWGERREYDE